MVKAYLRYVFSDLMGAVSGNCNVEYLGEDFSGGSKNKSYILAGSNQYVLLINFKTGEIIKTLYKEDYNFEVCRIFLIKHFGLELIISGYSNGNIVVWDFNSFEEKCTLISHKSQISAFAFSTEKSFFASGSADCSIVLWDLVGESSICKLKGHKNEIVGLDFMSVSNNIGEMEYLISAGKDGIIKVWDLTIFSSIITIPSKNSEIWKINLFHKESTLSVFPNSDEILFFRFFHNESNILNYESTGVKNREAFDKILDISQLKIEYQDYLAILTTSKKIELYKIFSENEAMIRIKKKARMKASKGEEMEIETEKLNFENRLKFSSIITLNAKAKSIKNFNFKNLAISYSDNRIEICSFKEKDKIEYSIESDLSLLSTKAPIRNLSLSSNDSKLVSASGDEVKLWAMDSKSVILTADFPSVLVCQFLPKNRYIAMGTKDGKIGLWDISSGEIVDSVSGHDAAIWALSVHEGPDGYDGVVILTGGADKHIRFWELVLKKQNRLGLVKSKEVYLEDEILSAKWSITGKFYAVSTLDSNIRVFFSDSDRLFLSLYGHKFPALTFSFSDDGALMASGSADKSIKVWGMDFGDLHKSIRAHSDSVTTVAFVNHTHYLFSGSKDRKVKYWDLDTFSLILEFDLNLKEVWCVLPSSIGHFFVAAGNDRCIRMWRQTQDQVFIDEEEQKRLDKLLVDDYAEKTLNQEEDQDENKETVEATKLDIQGLKYGDEIMARIDFVETLREELEVWEESKINGKDVGNPVILEKLGGLNPAQYVIKSMNSNTLSQLENSLKFLHLNYIEKLLHYIAYCAKNGIEIEICCRIVNFILKTHESSILASPKLLKFVKIIQSALPLKLEVIGKIIGYNMAALKMMREEIQMNKEGEELFAKDSLL